MRTPAAARSSWLVIGGLHLLNGSSPLSEEDPIIVVPVGVQEPEFTSNTVILKWSELGAVELFSRNYAGTRRLVGGAMGTDLFPGMLPGAAVSESAAAVGGRRLPAGPLVPLFYVSARGAELHVYSQIRFLDDDACFIRVTQEPISGVETEGLGWLPEALRLHADRALFLNNHQRYYRKCFAGKELEHKYTLTPPADIWTLTLEVYRDIRIGALPGYLAEYRDEFQAWDYPNHLFEVTGPGAGDRGYVSFIPTTDGKHLLKRKWYLEDSFERRESHTYGLSISDDGGFERYIAEELKVEAVRLPSFRRVRYDVNFESVRTGHVYGIFFDYCSLMEAQDVVLIQCELEYLRSRTAIAADESGVIAEMESVARWLESFLRARGLNSERGVYSKRTFLKDAIASRPELAGRAA